jgi:hypothetical protein
MKDTTWCGIEQAMVRPDGVQKGLRTVLEERGVDMNCNRFEGYPEVIPRTHTFGVHLKVLNDTQ